ncbi:MAG: hypothetical protein IID45_01940 [Planctomycetes bacterium]|nr:hypothetical protein [Planctomycetota bacterium]
MARTWKIRQAYVDAKSEKELKAARKAMIADLKKRYSGIDCHAPQDKIGPHKFLFRQLLQEWNPIGCTIEDLKAIAGKPRKETRDSVTYVFDSGKKAEIWIFKGRPQIVELGHRWGG